MPKAAPMLGAGWLAPYGHMLVGLRGPPHPLPRPTCRPLARIFVFRPRPISPMTPSLAMMDCTGGQARNWSGRGCRLVLVLFFL